MSRYTIAARPPYHHCVVGYDPPLGTFFAQVYKSKGPRRSPPLVHWVGADFGELPTVEALTAAIAAYVTVPDDIQQQLRRDGAGGARPNFGTQLLAELQHRMKESHR